jgi:DNA-binding NarL/FixJ family response regulator
MTVKVLILEDNPVARSFLCRVVRESFSDVLNITEASDLDAARMHINLSGGAQNLSGADPFKLILVDLELPESSGMVLLNELTRYPATKIVTSLYSDDEHLFPALQRGADGYLLKEDRFEVLVEELQKIVRGQPPLSPAIARRLLTHFSQGARHEDIAESNFMPTGPSANGPIAIEQTLDNDRLSVRESEVLTYLSKGFTIKEIASLVGIKWLAVNDHIKSIYKKLKISSRDKAPFPASQQGLV